MWSFRLLGLLATCTALNLSPLPPRKAPLPPLSCTPPLTATVALSLSLLLTPTICFAAAPTVEDVKISKGYEQISGLLDNWNEATTNCKTSNDNPYKGNCDRTPIKVMEVLGYKSTTSPLFNAEKVRMG